MLKKEVVYFKEIDSTNDYLKAFSGKLNHGTIISSKKQTKGRGRSDHSWMSEEGNLYFSYLLNNDITYDSLFQEIINISVTLVEVLKSLQINALIKYPNDILVNGKKISGILIESKKTDSLHKLIVGVGLNINQTDFKELSNKATSMTLENEINYKVENILNMIINNYNLGSKSFEDYLKLSIIVGRKIRYNNKFLVVKGITKDGRLVLEDDDLIYVSLNEITLEEIYE